MVDFDRLLVEEEARERAPGRYIDDVFGPGGLFARAFPSYEMRPGQVELARRVDASIRQGVPAIGEGPTGTGKSVAALVPLVWHLTEGREALLARRPAPAPKEGDLADLDSDERPPGEEEPEPLRAIYVTANIALQEQILRKDVPMLQRILPWPFTAAIAKGVANYLCLDRFDDAAAELVLEPLRDPSDRDQWLQVTRWAPTTQAGDFSELPFELRGSLRPKLSVSSDDCVGPSCPRRADCFAQKAKRAVKRATIIVANYHLLFAHLALSQEGASLLPRFDVAVLDEAHAMPDIARDFFGFRVTPGAIRHAARLLVPPKGKSKKGYLPTIDPELRGDIDRLAEEFFDGLREHRASPKYYARLTTPNAVDHAPVSAALRKAATLYQATADGGEAAPARSAELRRAARRARILAGDIERGVTLAAAEREIYYVDEEDRGPGIPSRVALCGAPLNPAPILRATLFESEELVAAIAMSATLATGRGRGAFDYAVRTLGAEAAEQLLVASPFDLARQALTVVPRDAPDPKAKDYAEQLAPLVVRAVALARGRTLGLFTSRRGLRTAAERVRAELGDQYTVLVQGEAPRTQLVERFRKDVSSVLLGTRSFWAGVDVPGEALSCVVIDRIPFDPPDDPLSDAMDEVLGRKMFSEWSIPRAAVELRQGYGRLIRSVTDRGVVVLLDRRLVAKPWGKMILRALPEAPLSEDLEDVGRFLFPEPRATPTRRRSAAGGAR